MFFKKKKIDEIKYDPYWIQNLELKQVVNREDYFFPLCKGKKVLHFGCTDYPIFNPDYNLHIKLSKIAKELHGFDIDLDGIEILKKYVNQPYYCDVKDLGTNEYDICLIPETIEHVENVGMFLKSLDEINAKLFIITGPNCFSVDHMARNKFEKGIFSEIVHPDHNCWYSPYTLSNVIKKYSKLNIQQIYMLQNNSMVCCEAVKN